MKKVVRFLGRLLGFVLAVLILIFGLVFWLPFDYIQYKRSLYYKTFRKKYRPFDGGGTQFEVYNIILKHQLPIAYVSNPDEDDLSGGWFVIGQTLLADGICCFFEYDACSDKWLWKHSDEEGLNNDLPLDELLAMKIEDANNQAGRKICEDAVLMIDADSVDPVELAIRDKRFLILDDKEAALLKFVADRGQVSLDG